MTLSLPTKEIAEEIFELIVDQIADRRDPLELLNMRDLAGELKMSLASLKRKVVPGEIPDADGHNGIRKVWTRGLVNKIKRRMLRPK